VGRTCDDLFDDVEQAPFVFNQRAAEKLLT
jgi:hypothetical protein